MSDLFEGLQIMTPEELESKVNEVTTDEVLKVEGEPTFSIEPVETVKDNKEEVVETTTTEPNEVKYKALMKELVTAGILTVEDVAKLDELPGNFDSIKKLMEEEVNNKFKTKEENWKKSLPSAKKRFLEIEDAFDETDQAIVMAQRLEFFENLDQETVVSNVDLQKQIYYEQLKAKNFSDADAIEAIEDAIAINKLEEKALKAIPELKKDSEAFVAKARESKELKTKEEQEAQTKAFEKLVQNIEARESFVEGLNLNKVAKDKLKSNILNPVHKDASGKEYNSLMYKQHRNPVEFEMLINYYDTLGLFDLDKEGSFKPNISKLKAVAKTAAVNELDKVIASDEARGVGRNTSVETSEKAKGILSLLDKAYGNK
jgi:hypothetical protein